MKVYRDKSLTEQVFVLEEASFFNCTLKDCDIFFGGGDFQIVDTKLDNCRVHFRGQARNTIAMMQTVGLLRGPIQLPPQATSAPAKPN